MMLCAVMVLGHICPVTKPSSFSENIHTSTHTSVSGYIERMDLCSSVCVDVCVCVCLTVAVAVTVPLSLSTAVKEDKPQLTSPTGFDLAEPHPAPH